MLQCLIREKAKKSLGKQRGDQQSNHMASLLLPRPEVTSRAMYHVFPPPLVFCLQVLGLLPASVDRLPSGDSVARVTRGRRLHSALCAATLAYAFAEWIWTSFYTENSAPFINTTLGLPTSALFTGFFSFLANFATAMACVATGAFRVSEKVDVVERLREVDLLLQGQGPTRPIVPLVFVTAFTSGLVVCDIGDSYQISITFAIIQIFKLFLAFGILEFSFLVLSIRSRFHLVNTRLVQAVAGRRARDREWTVALPFVETSAAQCAVRPLPASAFHLLTLCCRDVSAVYGPQLAVVVLTLLTHLLAFQHALYLMTFAAPAPTPVSVPLALAALWLVTSVFHVFAIVWPCARTIDEAKKTTKIVHKLLGNRMDKRLSEELEELSLQLAHSRVEFSACGLFNVDTPLIGSIASVVATYLALLIQLKTSPNNGQVHKSASLTNESQQNISYTNYNYEFI